MAVLVVATACAPTPVEEREPGEVDDVQVDLPMPHPSDASGHGTVECTALEACIAGPSVAGVVVESREDIDALAGVRCINGALIVSGPGIRDLRGLESIEVVCATIMIEGNPDLVDTIGLDGLDGALLPHSMSVTDNPALTSVTLPAAYSGRLQVLRNPRLEDLAGLAALRDLVLGVEDCDALVSVGPLSSLISGSISARDNDALQSIEAPQATDLDIVVARSSALVELALPQLRRSGLLSVSRTPGFSRLLAPRLEQLEQLALVDDASLAAVPEFPNLGRIDRVAIERNTALVDPSALADLESVEVLVVLNNPMLDQPTIEAIANEVATSHKVAGNAGWTTPPDCPFESDDVCDALACEGTGVCPEGSDAADCCECRQDCPIPPGS
jgi:hypothetical protein